jgi:hypothetical protein
MSQMKQQIRYGQVMRGLVLAVLLFGSPLFTCVGVCETYGIKDADGNFTPKLNVAVDKKEVVIRKTNPRDKFRLLSLKLNPTNRNLLRNVALLQVEWIGPDNRPSKPVPFAGPMYDRNTNVFQESMIKSVGLRIVDKSPHNLFAGKTLADLLAIRIDNQPIITAESVSEKERTVHLGGGRDVSINVDKNAVVFSESNLKRGEIINVDNRTGREQVLGVDIPSKGFVLGQIRRKLEQAKIPKEEWNRFTVPADQGIFIVLIPEPEPALLGQLDGREITIRVFQGNEVRETRRIPIEISPELRLSPGTKVSPAAEPLRSKEPPPAPKVASSTSKPVRAETNVGQSGVRYGVWLWVVQIANLILLVFLAVYTVFFMLPKVQVLEDRVAKSEMFIHGTREAIREELEQIKRDIIKECQQDEPQE